MRTPPIGALLALTAVPAAARSAQLSYSHFTDGVPLAAYSLEAAIRGAARPDPQIRIDGFEVTPQPGGTIPLPLHALVAAPIRRFPTLADRTWNDGDLVDVVARGGSNKLSADALLTGGASDPLATATLAGPLHRDRAWYAATLEGHPGGGRGLARVAWQITPRSKLELLALHDSSNPAGRLVGLTSESLLSDNLIARVQAGYSDRAQGSLDLQYFHGEHSLQIGARAAGPEDLRALAFVQEDWRAHRFLTVSAALAFRVGPLRRRASLGLAWDATQDGRTAVRASASDDVLAVGVARELAPGWLVASVDLVGRSIVFGLRHRDRNLDVDLDHELPTDAPGTHLTRASVVWSWSDELGLGALLTHAPRWSAGLRARAEIGDWLGFPLALFVDALDLPGDANLRLSLRSSY